MIKVEGLVKTYGFRETTLAVDHVSFTVPKRSRFGILGAAGAGKSTLVRILASVLRATEGSVRVGGYDVVADRAAVRDLVGYAPQDFDFRGWRSGAAYLHFWGRAGGLRPEERRARVSRLVEFAELGAVIEEDPVRYTIDAQKRLSLAQALLMDPTILLLDEPLTGLEEAARRWYVERLQRLTADGKTIVLTSPLFSDAQAACDQVAVMSEGRLTRVFGIGELLAKIGKGKDARVFVDADGLSSEALVALKSLKGVVDVWTAPTATIVYITPTEVGPDAIRKILEAHGVKVSGIREAQLKLGDVFSALNA